MESSNAIEKGFEEYIKDKPIYPYRHEWIENGQRYVAYRYGNMFTGEGGQRLIEEKIKEKVKNL